MFNSDKVILHTHLVPDSVIDRFYKYLYPSIVTGCWNWTGSRNKFGYGILPSKSINQKFAHRISWILYNGKIPKDMLVCHKCDNPSCVNPDHLFLGTAQDNADDKIKKGRINPAIGERNSMSKLSNQDVETVFKLHNLGVSSKDISEKLDSKVSSRRIRYIIEGKAWKHASK